jgi:hypothetical protein
MTTLAILSDPPTEELEARLRAEQGPPRPSESTTRINQLAGMVKLALLLAIPALICVHFANVVDPDLGCHLRTGEWILEHHAAPQVDPFSRPMVGSSWQDYSWLYDLVLIRLFSKLGLAGIVTYTAGMMLGITAAINHLVRRIRGDSSLATRLTFLAAISMVHLYTPRPWLFTILLFTLELDILMHARRSGSVREFVWLPVIFALWANVHIEFVYGLLLLALALVEATVSKLTPDQDTRLRPEWLGVALSVSAFATLINPYGWRVYSAAYQLATQKSILNKISELGAIPFRDIVDFLILLLALGSTVALARRQRFLPFESALLAVAIVLSFRSQRDEWAIIVVAVAILASTLPRKKVTTRLPRFTVALASAAAALMVWGSFRALNVNNPRLEAQVAKTLPADAVNAILTRGYPGPLYNEFTWAGYLMWKLRMPVSIDGRLNLYGDERIDRADATWRAEPDWASDPQLMSAGVVIGPVKASLTQLLRTDPHFQLVYEDNLAAVFIARQ